MNHKHHKPYEVNPRPGEPKGRELKGDGISQKCRTGQCRECTALRCQHDCGHGLEGTNEREAA